MKSRYKILDVGGAILDNYQLENYLEKLAADQILKSKSDKKTYPIPRLKDNLKFIYYVYNCLNEDLKNNIPIHPAGEWILDNFYIIDKNAKMVMKDLNLKKYKNLPGVYNGQYIGFARVYVLAKEIISYTDGKIDGESLQNYLNAYQNKKTLNMEELWCVNIFLQISLIEKIRRICEKIYLSQIQKRKVENIISRLVDFSSKEFKISNSYKMVEYENPESKYPFIEYMSYRLNQYGKKAYSYIEIFENQIEKLGTRANDCINREHFDIATKKISIGNSITSINALNRMNFIEIFNNINGVEEVLKKDPAQIYEKMDYRTKEYYRSTIEKISRKTKISELYISKICVELANKNMKKFGIENKKSHVGFYFISDGKEELLSNLLNKKINIKSNLKKAEIYINSVSIIAIIISVIIGFYINKKFVQFDIALLAFLFFIIPIKNLFIKIVQYISGKIVRPKLIPKMDFSLGIPNQYATMVVVPTIVKDRNKVQEIMKKLEVFYNANKSENLYFTLLGDCSSSKNEFEDFDQVVIDTGIKECEILNTKYPDENFKKFNFIYRKRAWNNGESCYLGWERKRGLLSQFNNFLLGEQIDDFRANTFNKIPDIKYVITLDADTNLVLNTGLELIGAMAHILNKPILNKEKTLVVDGYGIMQPRIGINLVETRKSIFTKIFSGLGGTDSYTNAISDFYQDNFGEGIFTGKGIYDLKVFSELLKGEIKENTVLSHDLLEGCYVRCGLVSDIMLMDGYPTTYNAYKTRLHRWIRGDYQILSWLFKNRLNILSKYKILDNINRSLLEACVVILLFLNIFIKSNLIILLSFISIIVPYILDFVDKIINKKNGEFYQKKYSKEIPFGLNVLTKIIIDISLIPDRAYLSVNAGIKSLYRMTKSKKHLLEWITAEDAEKNAKSGIIPYYTNMFINVILGLLLGIGGLYINNYIYIIVAILWILSPIIMNLVSKPIVDHKKLEELNEEEKGYVLDIAQRTWEFFKENINEKSNYLPPDNYQENRKEKIVYRTSPTNIGLGLLSVVASYDLGFETKEDTINLLEKMVTSIVNLPKWNGHLYNWYNIENISPLFPRYISSVDSGNFVGYLFVLKQFLVSENDKSERIDILIKNVSDLIDNTNFSILFDQKNGLFSIGYNVEEDKLTDSYYDLLASEARQTSLIAIAKKDVSAKHWKNLSRTLTVLNKYKGLISWSGTAFEYLMPTINIKRYPNSLLDESCKFMIMSQIEYAKKLGITWGISESAFNLRDLNGNYQYKAFGIPWLGLKRGLADEMVVSSYGTILAINDVPKLVVNNLKVLEKCNMYNKYGFYEAIDYTPNRVKKGEKYSVVKTYMAHHQGLILLSIDNLIKDNILQKRFFENPEIEAVDILLQERMPDNLIITKEKKEKIEKIKYGEYSYYAERIFDKKNEELNEYNLISNNDYTVIIDKNGLGYSTYKNKMINRYKRTDDCNEGIIFFIKNVKSKKVWSTANLNYMANSENFKVSFYPDKCKFTKIDENIKTNTSIIISPEDNVEIRNLELQNIGNDNEILEVSMLLEPVLSDKQQDDSHKAFNNLFISFEFIDDIIIVKRNARNSEDSDLYMAIKMYSENFITNNTEYELDKNNLFNRNSMDIPYLIKVSKPFSNKIISTTNPIVSCRNSLEIKENSKANVNLVIGVSENKDTVIQNVKKYFNSENVKRAMDLSKAQIEAKIQYFGINGDEVNLFQRIFSHIMRKEDNRLNYENDEKIYKTSELWKFGISGDIPILVMFIKEIGEINVLKQLVRAFEFFKLQGFKIDFVIVNEEQDSYENYVREAINDIIWNNNFNSKILDGKIFVLNNISNDDKQLLRARASLVFCGKCGKIELQLDDFDYEYLKKLKNTKYQNKKMKKNDIIYEEKISENKINMNELQFYNEYGGFSQDGKEYIININKNKLLPVVWSNVMANKNFGTVVTENMGGYTWYKNARLNRITAWNNDQVFDIPSEIIYYYDEENEQIWNTTPSPIVDDNEYYIKYGMGYTKYIHSNNSIDQELDVFVPVNDAVKVNIIHLKNKLPKKRKLKLVYYLKIVMGEDEEQSEGFIKYDYDANCNSIIIKNIANENIQNYAVLSSSEKIKSYTGNRSEFLGMENLKNPEGIKIESFSNTGSDSILAVNLDIEIEALGYKDISLIIGAGNEKVDCQNLSYKYSKIDNCNHEEDLVKKYWEDLTNRVLIKTPNKSMDILMNGWLIYQVLCSRIYAKSGFYQSGGAYGFRDQLQDSMCLKYFDSNKTKEQIIKHSSHQFLEGDVEHWWHDETQRGIRTKFSDDLLWLPYVLFDYIEYTGDYEILDIETFYLKGDILDNNTDEKYDLYELSEIKESIYKHCLRAINRSCNNLGEHGLPKIGTGDWNDGYNTVGNKGKGESVWLGFFLYEILVKFTKICEYKKDITHKEKFLSIAESLKKNLNNIAWDGRWFKRAFCDDGNVLGSIHNQECKIDSIAQSWSVISNAGDNDKKYIAMESLENHLVDRNNGIIKLLDPPFENGNLNPGYIKSYLPGTRENGGQYTHVCCC